MNKLISFFSRERNNRTVVKWNFIFYMITFVYSILIGVVLVPLYLKYIPRDVYGYWLATGNILNLITLIDPGFSGVVQQKISLSYGKRDLKMLGEYTSIGVISGLLFSVLIAIAGIYMYNYLPSLFPKLIETSYISDIKTAFFYSLVGSILMLIYFIFGAIDYGMLSSKGIGFINVTGNFGSMICIIILLKNGYGVIALGLAGLFRGVVYLALSLVYTLFRFYSEKITLSWNTSLLKEFISLMSFNFLGKIGMSATTQANSYISAVMLNPTATTVLKFTQTVPDFSKLFVTRLANSTAPIVPNLVGKGDHLGLRSVLSRLFYSVAFIIGLVFVGFFILNHSFIKLWVGDSFYGGDLMNGLVLTLLLFSIFSEVTSQIVFSLGNIKKNSLLFFIQGIIYIPLVIYLAKHYNLNGILIAGILSHLLTTAWYLPFSLFKIMHINKSQFYSFINETLKIILIDLSTILILKYLIHFDADNWFYFGLKAFAIVTIYISILLLISKRFRVLISGFVIKHQD